MKEIPLSRGLVALVDDADYEWLAKEPWHASPARCGIFYACRWRQLGPKRRKTIYMHKEIMQPPPGFEVDHRNGNSLDNRRVNLRPCRHKENGANQKKCVIFAGRPPSSRYKGVSWLARLGKWQANIGVNGKQLYLGLFESEIQAAIAYNLAAIEHFGEFARLNEIGLSMDTFVWDWDAVLREVSAGQVQAVEAVGAQA